MGLEIMGRVEKDMSLILHSAAGLGLTAPLTALSQQLYGAAIAKGYGEDDIYGLIGALEGPPGKLRLAGCEVSL
jgi:3-hydroxyisobutyrate dehydrogenase-like beta-hydroxyacid dehydrogenase